MLACAAILPDPAWAQRVTIEVLSDVEGWKTDSGSRLLARNQGQPLGATRFHALGLVRPFSPVELQVIGRFETSTASVEETESELELIALRVAPTRALLLEGGKILMPVGAFGRRRLSQNNPLIGAPDLYPTQYPWGAVVSGGVGSFDYAVGTVSLPVVNPRYSPQPSHRLRPVVRAGWSAGPALHIGASATHGPYLGADVTDQLPPAKAWHDYDQNVVAADLHFSIGYFDARAELAWSSYEVPTIDDPVQGWGSYAELRVAHTPRLFTAARLERFRYPFVLPVNATTWVGVTTTQLNGEIGVGYRLSRSGLAKISYRRDYWPDELRPGRPAFPDGYAIAAQLSFLLNLNELFERRY
jgi:hypothetical protein